MAKPNPEGWAELIALAGTGARPSVLLGLAARRALLELTEGRVYAVTVEQAPDAEYELERAGRLVVKDGKVSHVLGSPNAAAQVDPEG